MSNQMNQRVIYFPKDGVAKAVREFPTPFFLYEEARIRENCRNFRAAFEKYFPAGRADTSTVAAGMTGIAGRDSQSMGDSWAGFCPLYAVKANSNPEVLKIILEEGFGFDCSSESECWITGKISGNTVNGKNNEGKIGKKYDYFPGMFTGNYNPASELKAAHDAGFILNLDDVSMLDFFCGVEEKDGLAAQDMGAAAQGKDIDQKRGYGSKKARVRHVEEKIVIPETLSFRINPGVGKATIASNVFAGPNAKYGVPFEKAAEAYSRAREMGVKHFGIHMMTGSNVPIEDQDYFANIVRKLFDIVADIKNKTGIEIEFMNIGGGFGVPYRPEEKSLDMEVVAKSVRLAFDEKCKEHGLKEPFLIAEPGRWIVADAGWLVAKVIVIKDSYKKFVGIDASSNDMPRPSIYGAYHHMTVLKGMLLENAQASLRDLTDRNSVPGNGKSVTGETFAGGGDVPGNGSGDVQAWPLPDRGAEAGAGEVVSIVGRICENNDQLAQDRLLPKCKIGDIVIIHNCGGHAYSMGHNYNGRPRHAEYLLEENGDGHTNGGRSKEAKSGGGSEGSKLRMIRRAETFEDLYRTTEV